MSAPDPPLAPSGPAPQTPAPPPAGADPAAAGGDSNWAIAWRQFQKNRLAMAGVVVVSLLAAMAVFAPLLANGRPLYVRAYLSHLYDNEVAAFLDWDERLRAEARALRGAALPARERPAALARLERYRAGLPDVLTRLADALDAERAARLRELRGAYVDALGDGAPEALDLGALEQIGASIRADFCRLSLPTAYKAAAGPLLEVPLLLERLQEAPDPAPLRERLAALGAGLEGSLVGVLTFLEGPARAELVEAGAEATRALGSAELDPSAVSGAVRRLERALDAAAERPVPADLQQLPLVARWPAIAALGALEVFAMALYLALVALVVARRWLLAQAHPGRLVLLLGPGAAAAAALLWALAVPSVAPPAESLYKNLAAELAAAPDGVSAIVFAPVPFGENENIYADRVTPPALAEGDEHLANRLRRPGEASLSAEAASERLTRLRSHWLGTDDNGRDVLSRLIYGSRISLSVGFVAVGIYVAIGLVFGALAGFYGGWVDNVLMRTAEVVQSIPSFFLIITVIAVLPPSIWTIMLVIGLTHWTEVMRLVRGEFLRLKSEDFVTAGRALGFTSMRVVFRHILPNALGPVFVAATFGVAGAILIESALSFLGFGVPQPTASWGSVLNVAFQHEKEMWWITIFPGALIFLTITAYNLVGEGLRDALDPKLRQ